MRSALPAVFRTSNSPRTKSRQASSGSSRTVALCCSSAEMNCVTPQASGFNAYALLPLASAIFDALAMILTRTKCREEHPLVLSLALNVSFVAVGLLATLLIATLGVPAGTTGSASFLLGGWTVMATSEWLAMGLLAGAIIVGSVGAAIAYQVGPPATVATFDFAYVGFASVWGVLFFAEVPDAMTLAGMALIVVAGILAVRR